MINIDAKCLKNRLLLHSNVNTEEKLTFYHLATYVLKKIFNIK